MEGGGDPIRVLVAYSREDTDLVDEFCDYLKAAFGDQISIFRDTSDRRSVDRTIGIGNWFERLSAAHQEANVIIGIVSSAFYRSEWFHAEVVGALLYGKLVVPIVVSPLTARDLVGPTALQQAFELNSLNQLLERLADKFQLTTRTPEFTVNGMSALQPEPTLADMLISGDPELRASGATALMDYQRFFQTVDDWVTAMYGSSDTELRYSVEVNFDERGRAEILRRESLRPTKPTVLTYFQLYVDKPGMIELRSVTYGDTGALCRFVLKSSTPTSRNYVVLFNAPVSPGEEVVLNYVAHAENYLSDLVEKGVGRLFFSVPRRVRVLDQTITCRFPNTPTFQGLQMLIAESRDAKIEGTHVEPRIGEQTIEFSLRLTGDGVLPNGQDAFQFSLRSSTGTGIRNGLA